MYMYRCIVLYYNDNLNIFIFNGWKANILYVIIYILAFDRFYQHCNKLLYNKDFLKNKLNGRISN